MWEIYSYHSIDGLFGIFNAVAGLVDSVGYDGMLAVVAIIGFMVALAVQALAPQKMMGWRWLLSFVLVFSVLLVPRVTVVLVDRTGGAADRPVANVPLGLAVLASMTSAVGNATTEIFETAFQALPGASGLAPELSYQQNGLMFGSRTIQATREVRLDPVTTVDMMNFINNCTVFDLQDGGISRTAFSASNDVWTLMGNTNPARFTILTADDGSTTVSTCDDAYGDIDGRLPDVIDSVIAKVAARLNPSLAPIDANGRAPGQIVAAYTSQQLASAAATAADIVRQNALLNAVEDAGKAACQKVDDPGCMTLAYGRSASVAAQNASWIAGGRLAQQALPIFRNAAEALIYAIFPVVLLLTFVASPDNVPKILAGYVAALIGIQLWPPLFAVLNYIATLVDQLNGFASGLASDGSRGNSLQTSDAVYSNAVSAQAVVSYITIGVPFLAQSLSNRLTNLASASLGGLSGLQSSSMAGSATASASVGNVSSGIVSMGQQNITPSLSNPHVRREMDEFGNWHTYAGGGRHAVDFLRNSGIVGGTLVTKTTKADVDGAGRNVASASSEYLAVGEQRATTLNSILSAARNRSSGSRSSSGITATATEETQQAAEKVADLTKKVAKALDISDEQAGNLVFRLGAGSDMLPIKGGIDVSAQYGSKFSGSDRQAMEILAKDSTRAVRSFMDAVKRDKNFTNTLEAQGSSGSQLVSSFNDVVQRSDQAEQRLTDALSRYQTTSLSYEAGVGLTNEFLADPKNTATLLRLQDLSDRHHGNPQAIMAGMMSEVAAISGTPSLTRFRDGSRAPGGFEDLRGDYSDRRDDLDQLGSLQIASAQGEHDRDVRSGVVAAPGVVPAAGRVGEATLPPARPSLSTTPADLLDSGAFRQGIRTEVTGQRKSADGAYARWQQERGIVQDSRGGYQIPDSLVGRAGSAWAHDLHTKGNSLRVDAEEFIQRFKDGLTLGTRLPSNPEKYDEISKHPAP